jgi:heparin binding hemagglutinin HbhA
MTLAKDIRKTVTDTTPVYAAVGVTDLAVERLREARARAAASGVDLSVSAMQDRAVKRIEKVSEQALHIPVQVRDQTVEAADKAQHTYTELAMRGEKLVKRLRNQKSTQDLLAQADNTVSLGKGAVTTVRKAATETQRAAKATLTTSRHEAEAVRDAVVSSIHREADTTTKVVKKSAAATRTSAKRTATTAKKSTAAAERVTKSTATSAARTASAAAEATKVATPKIGD